MSKGEQTRAAILDAAIKEAAVVGVGALSIGNLASRTGMSKSGLFGHFGSKESLQLAVMVQLVERFTEVVVLPALKVKGGIARLEALFENYTQWVCDETLSRGCPLMSIAFELDAQPGPLRDYIVGKIAERIDVISRVAQKCVQEGAFKKDLDIERFAYAYEGLTIAYMSYRAVLNHSKAKEMARATFDNLINSSLK
ncbi:MAG: TetR/AcrR family transcriptional regulator [Rhodospirillales bacterium]|nr:TetR/AcrR family transcriptional regulator [Rhodospirillales bacterium]